MQAGHERIESLLQPELTKDWLHQRIHYDTRQPRAQVQKADLQAHVLEVALNIRSLAIVDRLTFRDDENLVELVKDPISGLVKGHSDRVLQDVCSGSHDLGIFERGIGIQPLFADVSVQASGSNQTEADPC